MTNDTRKALVEIGLKMARSARDGGCDTHGHAIELFTEQVERDGDCIETQAAEIEKLEALFTNATYEARAMMEEIERLRAELSGWREMAGKAEQ